MTIQAGEVASSSGGLVDGLRTRPRSAPGPVSAGCRASGDRSGFGISAFPMRFLSSGTQSATCGRPQSRSFAVRTLRHPSPSRVNHGVGHDGGGRVMSTVPRVNPASNAIGRSMPTDAGSGHGWDGESPHRPRLCSLVCHATCGSVIGSRLDACLRTVVTRTEGGEPVPARWAVVASRSRAHRVSRDDQSRGCWVGRGLGPRRG